MSELRSLHRWQKYLNMVVKSGQILTNPLELEIHLPSGVFTPFRREAEEIQDGVRFDYYSNMSRKVNKQGNMELFDV
jgi:hypothetical protein